ncbi:hypothetical protein KI387_031727, partial [Taxus chinensis]
MSGEIERLWKVVAELPTQNAHHQGNSSSSSSHAWQNVKKTQTENEKGEEARLIELQNKLR